MPKDTPKKVAEKSADQGPEAKKKDVVPARTPKRTAPEPIPPRKPLISFDRWFASKKKFKPHWKSGMAVYTNTSIRRTVDEWDKAFLGY